MKTFIYTLAHPETGEIRYVGKTTNLKRRYYTYSSPSALKNNPNKHLSNWILSFYKKGLKPIMEILDETEVNNWQELEKFWINQFKFWNFKLINLTDGGEGTSGYKVTEQQKRKHSKKIKELHKKGLFIGRSIKISQYDNNGLWIKNWDSSKKAGDFLKTDYQNINKATKILSKRVKGYYFRKLNKNYKEKILTHFTKRGYKKGNVIIQYDLNDNIIEKYNNVKTASLILGLSQNTIRTSLLGKQIQYNFYFLYENKPNIIKKKPIKYDSKKCYCIESKKEWNSIKECWLESFKDIYKQPHFYKMINNIVPNKTTIRKTI
jgi:group I intron endonuclease